MDQKGLRSDCSINYIVEMLGDKWSLLIIRDILLHNKRSYAEFLTSKEKIATNILAARLDKLEKAGLIIKEPAVSAGKTKFIYSLTQKGVDLTPVFVEIVLWAAKYCRLSPGQQKLLRKARQDKQALIQELEHALVVRDRTVV